MVINKRFYFLLILFLLPNYVLAITVDELRAISGAENTKKREKAARYRQGDLRGVVNAATVNSSYALDAAVSEISAPQANVPPSESTIPAVDSVGHRVGDQGTQKNQAQAQTQTNEGYLANVGEYIPPSRRVSGKANSSDAVPKNTRQFGISLGTWLKGKLTRDINNRENSLTIVKVKQGVKGKNRVLKPGTQLFASKVYNAATKRLELKVLKGITPQGREFPIKATIYDDQKIAGLTGIVKAKKVMKPSVERGLLSGGSRIISDIVPDNPFGIATSTTANLLLDEGNTAVNKELVNDYIIYVTMQNLLIRIDETF